MKIKFSNFLVFVHGSARLDPRNHLSWINQLMLFRFGGDFDGLPRLLLIASSSSLRWTAVQYFISAALCAGEPQAESVEL